MILLSLMGFSEKVYELTRQIPKGKVTTYGELARAMNTHAYRAVGQALHVNPYAPHVPCHRVIASDGSLGGFASGMKKKVALLKREGVKIDGNRVDLERYFFALNKKKGHHVPSSRT